MKSDQPVVGILPPVSQGVSRLVSLGARVRQLRQQRNLTLQQVSQLTGVAQSTLSKMENEQLSPTFKLMQKLVLGLDIDISQLFAPVTHPVISGRRSVTLRGAGRQHLTPTYQHELLATDLASKTMIPFKSRVRARELSEFKGWLRHEGEELLLVLEGIIIVYTEAYEPLQLNVGDSIYFDSSMGHAVVSNSPDDALVLWVCSA